MRNYIFATALLVAMGLVWPADSARAAVYTYEFQSLPGQPAETMTGTLTVVNGEVTRMTGTLSRAPSTLFPRFILILIFQMHRIAPTVYGFMITSTMLLALLC